MLCMTWHVHCPTCWFPVSSIHYIGCTNYVLKKTFWNVASYFSLIFPVTVICTFIRKELYSSYTLRQPAYCWQSFFWKRKLSHGILSKIKSTRNQAFRFLLHWECRNKTKLYLVNRNNEIKWKFITKTKLHCQLQNKKLKFVLLIATSLFSVLRFIARNSSLK